MTKKGATILALVTTVFYFIVSIVVMLVYKGESGVVEKGNQFLTFLLVQAPKIIFLFGLTVYFLVLSALAFDRKNVLDTNEVPSKTKSATNNKTTKQQVKNIEREEK